MVGFGRLRGWGPVSTLTLTSQQVQRATLKAKVAAGYLGISYWKLLELVKAGDGPPHIRAGSRILFRVETLDNWLSQQEAASAANGAGAGPGPELTGKIRRLK